MKKIRVKGDEVKEYFPNLKISRLLQTILKQRGYNEADILEFLNASDSKLEDPFKLFGMRDAVNAIKHAIKANQKIVIHGDFDVDGISATAILWDYLFYEKKADVTPIIPHRVDEGYGLSEKTIQKAIDLAKEKENKKPFLITVDCGIKDIALVEKYKDSIDFIITDHHQFYTNENGEIELPKARAVIHSAHPESTFSCMISGAATAWQLVRALETHLLLQNESLSLPQVLNLKSQVSSLKNSLPKEDSQLNFFKVEEEMVLGTSSTNVDKYLDLVALSTVCDIIPLTKENRKLVLKGLKQIAKAERIGLAELMKIAAVDPKNISAFHFGFVLGPRLNAPGRVTNDATDALRLLVTRNYAQAEGLAIKLNELNIKRKDLTQHYIEIVEHENSFEKKAIIVLGEEWPEGILGLIAGKLAEKYKKPAFIASKDQGGHIIGSSRSPLENIYLNKALEYAKEHLERFGGHKQAAGFASNTQLFDGFEIKVIEYLEKYTSDTDYEQCLEIELEIKDISQITLEDIESLKLLEPYGLGNPQPIFLLTNCIVLNFSKLGKEFTHLKLQLQQGATRFEAIGFNMADKTEKLTIGGSIDIIGSFSINTWNGQSKIQVEIKEIMSSE